MLNQILKLNSSKINLDMMSKLVPKETEIIINPLGMEFWASMILAMIQFSL